MNARIFVILIFVASLCGCSTAPKGNSARSERYEYVALPTNEIFSGEPDMQSKLANTTLHVGDGFKRTDMDAADYTRALNRLSAEGWEFVAVSKSNYWIFRRPKK